MVALVILLFQYDHRIEFYPNIIHRLKLLNENLKLEQNLEKIALQLIRTRDTLEIGRKLQEDLMQEMAKIKPKLEDKLKMDDIREELLEEGRNPDWESVDKDLLWLAEPGNRLVKWPENDTLYINAMLNFRWDF